MKTTRTGSMLMILVLLLTAGCEPKPVDESITVTEPDQLDLIGVYEIDKVRLPADLADLKLDTRLELRADGTFNARNIPPPLPGELPPGNSFLRTLTSCTGVWSKRKSGFIDPGHQTIWGIHLADKPYTAANANGSRKEWLSVRCTGQTPPYGILFQLGDPKQGYGLHLKLINPKPGSNDAEPRKPAPDFPRDYRQDNDKKQLR